MAKQFVFIRYLNETQLDLSEAQIAHAKSLGCCVALRVRYTGAKVGSSPSLPAYIKAYAHNVGAINPVVLGNSRGNYTLVGFGAQY